MILVCYTKLKPWLNLDCKFYSFIANSNVWVRKFSCRCSWCSAEVSAQEWYKHVMQKKKINHKMVVRSLFLKLSGGWYLRQDFWPSVYKNGHLFWKFTWRDLLCCCLKPQIKFFCKLFSYATCSYVSKKKSGYCWVLAKLGKTDSFISILSPVTGSKCNGPLQS